MFDGARFGHFWPLNAMQALPILNMSVSDTNKVRKFPAHFSNIPEA
eukprot:COSAG02_NODE_1004_length_15275_cov_11.955917_12_plen_46_part_00